MKRKSKIVYIFFSLLFFFIGISFAVYIFSIDVDLLSVPYINKGVIFTEDIDLVQEKIYIHIPKGTQLLLTRRMPGSNEYRIIINIFLDDEKSIKFLDEKPKYFEPVVPKHSGHLPSLLDPGILIDRG